MANVRMGFYPTDLSHVELLKRGIVFPECEVNLLDPLSLIHIFLTVVTRYASSDTTKKGAPLSVWCLEKTVRGQSWDCLQMRLCRLMAA